MKRGLKRPALAVNDQIINNAAKLCYMSGGTASVPVVVVNLPKLCHVTPLD